MRWLMLAALLEHTMQIHTKPLISGKDVEHNGHACVPVAVNQLSAPKLCERCLEESLQPRHEELFARSLTPKQLEGLSV
jgi:hypothetical protein